MNRRIGFMIGALAALAFTQPLAAQSSFVVDSALVESGRRVFSNKACIGCHTIGKGDLAAPDLSGLFERRSTEWIRKWLRDPAAMLASDETAKQMLKESSNLRMPNLKLTGREIDALMHYIADETKAMRPGGTSTQ